MDNLPKMNVNVTNSIDDKVDVGASDALMP